MCNHALKSHGPYGDHMNCAPTVSILVTISIRNFFSRYLEKQILFGEYDIYFNWGLGAKVMPS